MPTRQERAEILRIHIAKRGRDPEEFPLGNLAEISDGFNGSELEEAVIARLYEAFHAGRDTDAGASTAQLVGNDSAGGERCSADHPHL